MTTVEKAAGYGLNKVVEKYTGQKELQALLLKHANVFAKHKHNLWAYGSYHFHRRFHRFPFSIFIDVPTQRQYPFTGKPYTPLLLNPIYITIAALLEQEVLCRCTSTANSPFWLVQKPDGSWCLTIDYRCLGQAMPPYAASIAKMPDLTESFDPKAVWFTVLDVGNGFWALLLVRVTVQVCIFLPCGPVHLGKITLGIS